MVGKHRIPCRVFQVDGEGFRAVSHVGGVMGEGVDAKSAVTDLQSKLEQMALVFVGAPGGRLRDVFQCTSDAEDAMDKVLEPYNVATYTVDDVVLFGER